MLKNITVIIFIPKKGILLEINPFSGYYMIDKIASPSYQKSY